MTSVTNCRNSVSPIFPQLPPNSSIYINSHLSQKISHSNPLIASPPALSFFFFFHLTHGADIFHFTYIKKCFLFPALWNYCPGWFFHSFFAPIHTRSLCFLNFFQERPDHWVYCMMCTQQLFMYTALGDACDSSDVKPIKIHVILDEIFFF